MRSNVFVIMDIRFVSFLVWLIDDKTLLHPIETAIQTLLLYHIYYVYIVLLVLVKVKNANIANNIT